MNEMINKLIAVVNALNHISTAGKQNLLNLGAAIEILEGIIADANNFSDEEKE